MIYETWLINNLCIWAIYASFKEGMIFEKLGRHLVAYLYWLVRPDILTGKRNYYRVRMSIPANALKKYNHYREWKIETDKVDYWLKPFFRCPVCMPSIWGSLGFFIFATVVWYYWPLYVITMVGLNYIISQLISKTIKIDNE